MIRDLLLALAVALGLLFLAKFGILVFGDSSGVPLRHGYTVAWFVWMLLSLLGFVVIEGAALLDSREGDTLTEHIQWVAGQSEGWAAAVIVGIVSFFGWFVSHLFGRDSRVWRYLSGRRRDGGGGDRAE